MCTNSEKKLRPRIMSNKSGDDDGRAFPLLVGSWISFYGVGLILEPKSCICIRVHFILEQNCGRCVWLFDHGEPLRAVRCSSSELVKMAGKKLDRFYGITGKPNDITLTIWPIPVDGLLPALSVSSSGRRKLSFHIDRAFAWICVSQELNPGDKIRSDYFEPIRIRDFY